MIFRSFIAVLAFASLATLEAQAPAPRPFKVVRLDPALDAIISTDAKIEILGEHFGLTEGPVWIREGAGGYLLFSDCAANVIYKWMAGKPLSVYLEKSGYTGTDTLHVGQQTVSGRLAILLIGSNGLALDPQGRLIITAMTDRNVVRLEKDGKRTVLADRYEGKRFSGPNDVVVKSDGAVYFTDSVNGLRGGADGPLRELPFNGVYRIKDGAVTLLDSDRDRPGEFPNGIAFSPDEKYLYVTAGFGKTLRWDVQPDGSIANPAHVHPGGQRRHEGRPQRESLFGQRGGSGRGLDYVARGQASGHPPTAADSGRAAAANLCEQRGVRRSGRQGSLHHRLHAPVQGPAEDGSALDRGRPMLPWTNACILIPFTGDPDGANSTRKIAFHPDHERPEDHLRRRTQLGAAAFPTGPFAR